MKLYRAQGEQQKSFPRRQVIHDVGKSIAPVIDIGQIEGAFTQGMGLATTEEVVYLQTKPDAKTGLRQAKHFSVGPGMYKIPSMRSCPRDFRVHLLENSAGPTVMGSKAVGEPPLFLGMGVHFAIREAILAYRAQQGRSIENVYLDSPLTSEAIRMACEDVFTPSRFSVPSVATSAGSGGVRHWHARV